MLLLTTKGLHALFVEMMWKYNSLKDESIDMNNLSLFTHIWEHLKNFVQGLLHRGNRAYLCTLLQKKLFGNGLLLLISNAIHFGRRDKSDNTQIIPPINFINRLLHDSNKIQPGNQCGKPIDLNNCYASSEASGEASDEEFDIYLCNYRYKGKVYSIDICATSFEDAEARRKALSNGKIIGILKMSIPVNQSLYFAILKFWKALFGKV